MTRANGVTHALRVEIDNDVGDPLTTVYDVECEALTSPRKVMPNVTRGHSVIADVDEHGARTLAREYGASFPSSLGVAGGC